MACHIACVGQYFLQLRAYTILTSYIIFTGNKGLQNNKKYQIISINKLEGTSSQT